MIERAGGRPVTHRMRIGVAVAAAVVVVLAVAAVLVLRDGSAEGRDTTVGDRGRPAGPVDLPGSDVASPSTPAPSASAVSAAAASGTHPPAAAGAPPPAAGAPQNTASRLRTLPAATRQVLVVSADGYDSTTATLEAFAKTGNGWQPAFAAVPARVGARGFADRKAEGDLKTPTGVYSVGGTMYGIAGNPGVRYAYHQLVADDWWNSNPATPGYNTFTHGANPGGASEPLWETSPQYTHFAVINYNVPARSADPPRGSGIFLHQMMPGRATAGCVSVAADDLVRVLRWLDPSASPRIVLAPRSALSRY